MIDSEGRIYRHVYGSDFEAPALVEPLKDLMFGRRVDLTNIAGLIDRVRLFCTFYDPASERYKFDYSIFISITIGMLSIIALATILITAWRRSRDLERKA